MAPPAEPTLSPYPTTRHSLVAAAGATAGAERQAAVEALIRLYWRPAYGRLRLKWQLQAADAEDLVQEFFAGLLEGEVFARYDPRRARFRTYLRSCLDRFAAKARRRERRLKRGGGAVHRPLDFAGAERELGAAQSPDPDAWFDREWVRALLTYGVEELRRQSVGTQREIRFRVFETYDLVPADDASRPGYRDIAARFDLPVTQVTNHLLPKMARRGHHAERSDRPRWPVGREGCRAAPAGSGGLVPAHRVPFP